MQVTAETIKNAMLGDAQDSSKIENCKPQAIPATETDAEYQARVLDGRAFFAAFDAARLDGSEKQIAWAKDIRRKKMVDIIRNYNLVATRARTSGQCADAIIANIDKINQQLNELLNQSSAKWWIDNR